MLCGVDYWDGSVFDDFDYVGRFWEFVYCELFWFEFFWVVVDYWDCGGVVDDVIGFVCYDVVV